AGEPAQTRGNEKTRLGGRAFEALLGACRESWTNFGNVSSRSSKPLDPDDAPIQFRPVVPFRESPGVPRPFGDTPGLHSLRSLGAVLLSNARRHHGVLLVHQRHQSVDPAEVIRD